jgi:hypothetical protein
MRRWRLNSGYCGNTDQRRTAAGTIPILKHYMERDLGLFNSLPWTPAQITTALWLDAADASTITLNSTTVSQWNDKSGNARHATQADGANQPTRTLNGLNGKTVLTFNGSNSFLGFSNLTINDNNTYIYSVYSRPTAGTHTLDIASDIFVGSSGRGYGNWWFTDNVLYTILRETSPATFGTHGSSTATGTFINGAVRTSSGTQTWRNGTSVGTLQQTSGTFVTGPVFNQIGRVGGSSPNFSYHNGTIAEIIMGRESLSDSNRQRIEGYLAHKWGLQANLPIDHPYKTAEP